MTTDYIQNHQDIRLQILKDRYDLHRLNLEKMEARKRQQFDRASALLSETRTISDRLKSSHEQLSADYHTLDASPQALLSMVYINSLLAEFHDQDSSLTLKLHTLQEYLHAQQLEALNRNDKPRAAELAGDLRLVSEAMLEQKQLFRVEVKRTTKTVL